MPSERTYNALNFTVGGCIAGYASYSALRGLVMRANGAVPAGGDTAGVATLIVFAFGCLLMGYSLAGGD